MIAPFTIETGVPIPEPLPFGMRLSLPLDKLALGQSIFLAASDPDFRAELRRAVADDVAIYSQRTGRGLIVRSVRDPMGVRLWLHSVPAEFVPLGTPRV